MDNAQIVYLVEDDDALRLATGTTLRLAGYKVADYADAESFLASINHTVTGCLLTDLLLPGMSGLELQQELIDRKIKLPVIFMTGYGDINESVQAIKSGAIDFVEKPVAPSTLLQRIQEAIKLDSMRRLRDNEQLKSQQRFDALSPREKDVIIQVVDGKTNKEIARNLDISYRTVEKYRASAMLKLEVDNVVELARLVHQFLP